MIHILLSISIMIATTNTLSAESQNSTNLSHEQRENSLKEAVSRIETKIKTRQDLPYVTVERQLELVNLLVDFGLGRFLLERGGLNGYWTDYIIKHPSKGRLSGLNDENKPFNSLEAFLLNQAPTVLATQQRFEIFKAEIQKKIYSGAVLASIPCGLMADLLDLDFTGVAPVTLIGIDLDPESIACAKQYAETVNLSSCCQFFETNAWDLNLHEALDLITSNGLAIYEPKNERVIELYRGFFQALKPGGYLITSFLTPPPIPGLKTEWEQSKINAQDALLQKILFSHILDCKWQVFRTEETVKSQIETAGFKEIEIIYDEAHIFPTVVARKPF